MPASTPGSSPDPATLAPRAATAEPYRATSASSAPTAPDTTLADDVKLREALLARVLSVPSATTGRWAALEAEWAAEDAAVEASDAGWEPPTEEELADLGPDPDCDPPDGDDAWLAMLPGPLREEYFATTARPGVPEAIKAGFWDRTDADGCGFASGGSADTLEPGPVLAGLAGRAWDDGLRRLSDDELIGVLRAGRRLASWAAALELAATADLMHRRETEAAVTGDLGVIQRMSAEVAAALTLTARAADEIVDLAASLGGLPATVAALREGRIDRRKAAVIAGETASLSPAHRAAVERHVLRRAPDQTTGELRAAVRRAVISADPAAARKRHEKARREARVERWAEDAGTAALAGRDLPSAEALVADQYISDLARRLKRVGATGTMDQIRARVFLALLGGQPPESLLRDLPGAAAHDAPGRGPGHAGGDVSSEMADPGEASARRGPGKASARRGPGETGMGGIGGQAAAADNRAPVGVVNLTLPLFTWLGLSEVPGDVAGYGPLAAADGRDLAAHLARNPATTWCLTLIGASGHPVAHGCVRAPPATGPPDASPPDASPSGSAPGARGMATPRWPGGVLPSAGVAAWLAGVPLAWLETGVCGHRRESRAYRPPLSLQHLIRVRQRTCAFPGCRRPAWRCDQEHTTPFHRGGRTCECNLAPICRYHHEVKQAPGWRLEQAQPGVLTWTAPSGRRYTTGPTTYPV